MILIKRHSKEQLNHFLGIKNFSGTTKNLNVKGMMKNKHLSESVAEQSFYEFYRQIEYKSSWNNIKFIIADRFYPSSKLCSCCGAVKKDLKLNDRVYKCDNCITIIDRDKNASINLRNET